MTTNIKYTQSLSGYRDYLKSVLNCLSDDILEGGPHIAQCIGTNRLWGPAMGIAFANDFNLEEHQDTLEKLAILSRAYLVIQDHVMDEEISKNNLKTCHSYMSNIDSEVRDILNILGANPDEFSKLCKFGWNAFEERKNVTGNLDIVKNARDKCRIFFAPYAFDTLPVNKSVKDKRTYFLNDFFHACQMLDDFHDINQDIQLKTNHNLFLYKRNLAEMKTLEKLRPEIAPYLVDYIDKKLKKHKESLNQNHIFSSYLSHSLEWLSCKRQKFSQIPKSKNFEWINEPPYVVNLRPIKNEFNLEKDITTHMERLMPEFLQTELTGIETIEQIQRF